jgi:hypothetical protein
MGTVYQFKTTTDGIIDVANQIEDGLITGPKLVDDIVLPAGTTISGAAGIATQDDIDIINQGMLPHAAVQTVLTKANVAALGGSGAWSGTDAGTITLDNVSINGEAGTNGAPTLVNGDRVLLRFTDAGEIKYSGIYSVTNIGVLGSVDAILVRASDFNVDAELVVGAYVNVVGTAGTNSPALNNAYFLQSKGSGVLNTDDLTFVLWGTNTVTLAAGQGIDITSNVVSAVLAAGGPLSFDNGAIKLDFADPLYLDGTDLALHAADGAGQAGYMSSADFNKLAAMGDSITQTASPLQTNNTETADFALPTQSDGTVAVYQIRLLAHCASGFIAQTIEFATACASGVVSQLDSTPGDTVVTEYHSDNGFKDLSADFLSGGSGGAASLHIVGLNGHNTTYTVTCVRQVY